MAFTITQQRLNSAGISWPGASQRNSNQHSDLSFDRRAGCEQHRASSKPVQHSQPARSGSDGLRVVVRFALPCSHETLVRVALK